MYKIKKVDRKITDINDKLWETAEVAEVTYKNWGSYECEPYTTARVLYSDFGLHVKLATDEKKLFATHRVQNEEVCEDSCMEFFFRANENDLRYFNFEFNPFGTMYMSTRKSRSDFYFPEVDKHYFEVQSSVEPDVWSLIFTVPFEFIEKQVGGHTKKMFGNFYKCNESNQHYFTYTPVATDHPDFHQPTLFGELELE